MDDFYKDTGVFENRSGRNIYGYYLILFYLCTFDDYLVSK